MRVRLETFGIGGGVDLSLCVEMPKPTEVH